MKFQTAYAYPSSPAATKLGKVSTGCFYVTRGVVSPRIVSPGFDTHDEARQWAKDNGGLNETAYFNVFQYNLADAAQKLTKAEFMRQYRAELLGAYQWATDAAKLAKFMDAVYTTITSDTASQFDHNGPLALKAWRTIGGKGRVTLKGLRALA